MEPSLRSQGGRCVVEGECTTAVLIARLGRHGTGFVGVLNEVPVTAKHEFGRPAVLC